MKRLLLAASLFPSIAFAGQTGITVSHPWFRYLLPQIPAGGFMMLRNATGTPVKLTGVRSPACGMAMLHESLNKSGTDIMVGVKSVTIPAHGDFAFAPGHYHVMCMQPKMKIGETVPMTLEFAQASPLTVRFKVYGASGAP